MKYLKKINESNIADSIKYFCETNLSYLVDDGMQVSIHDDGDDWIEVILYSLHKTWNQVKDHMIPFLIRLKSKYDLDEFYGDEDWNISFFIEEEGDTIYYNIDTIINYESLNSGNLFITDDNQPINLMDDLIIVSVTFFIKSCA